MFKKTIHNSDDIYEVLINFYSIEKDKASKNEELRRLTEKNNNELVKDIEYKNKIISNQESEIQRLNKLCHSLNEANERLTKINDGQQREILKHNEFVRATISKMIESQKNALKVRKANKATKADFIAKGMFKIDDSTRARLK